MSCEKQKSTDLLTSDPPHLLNAAAAHPSSIPIPTSTFTALALMGVTADRLAPAAVVVEVVVVAPGSEVDVCVRFPTLSWAFFCGVEGLAERRRSAALRPGVPQAPRAGGGVVGWRGEGLIGRGGEGGGVMV